MASDINGESVQRLAGQTLLVLGDFMLDRYIWGSVERVSPEAPVPIVLAQRVDIVLGGAGNVVRNIVSLGGNVTVAGTIGQDAAGDKLLELLEGLGVDPAGLVRTGEQVTIEKTRVVVGHQQLLRIDQERPTTPSPLLLEQLAERITVLLPGVQGVIVSDYGKGLLTPELVSHLIARSHSLGVPVLVDPKGQDYSKYRGATVVTPNHRELALVTGRPTETDEEVVAAGQQLLEPLHLAALLVTRGARGMTLLRSGYAMPIRVHAQARQVFDVTGAGDTVIAVLGLGLAAGLPLTAAARLASAAAGIVVGKVGTAVVHPTELQAALSQQPVTEPDKLKTWPELQDCLEILRRKGQHIVFTNGCFDLLHVGHIHLLRESRRLGDVLVVGLNSDRSIRQIKGPERPILPETDRVQLLSALSCVDYVVVFDEETPERLLHLVRPDVLTKGNDYAPSEVVGRETVEGYGGQVILIPLLENRSTGELIDRIAQHSR